MDSDTFGAALGLGHSGVVEVKPDMLSHLCVSFSAQKLQSLTLVSEQTSPVYGASLRVRTLAILTATALADCKRCKLH